MKYRSVLLKSLVLVLVFAVLLSVGISLLSYSNIGTRNSEDFSTPEINTNTVNAPLSQRQLQKKYNKYNTVTEENGKSVVTIFSEEQIADFNDRRNSGEWFWLSSEEMLFLINDTVELFKTYDIVYIRDIDGNLNKYYGLSFFSSEEYYNSFGLMSGISDASYSLKFDIYDTIFKRFSVLNCATYSLLEYNYYAVSLSDISKPLSKEEEEQIIAGYNPYYSTDNSKHHQFGSFFFQQGHIDYYLINETDIGFTNTSQPIIYPNNLIPETVGISKYDCNEKVVIIEVHDVKKEAIVARIRIAESTHPNEISLFEKLLDSLEITNEGLPRKQIQNTDYRAVVYFNGIKTFWTNDNRGGGIIYCPDGNIELYSYVTYENVYTTKFQSSGSKNIATFINEILANNLN